MVKKGAKLSKKIREKMSAAAKKRPRRKHSEETKKKIGFSNLGKKYSEEAKAKMRLAWVERKKIGVSEETRKKISIANTGKKLSKETKLKLRLSKLGDKNPNWKGDNVSLGALHTWIKKRKPKSKICERCKKNPTYDLANISQKYYRDINDFEWLCRGCHMNGDGRMNNLKQYG